MPQVKQRMKYKHKNALVLPATFQTLIKMIQNVIAEMTMHRLINDHISGSDSSESDSEESNSSHKVIAYSRSSPSDRECGRDEDSIQQILSKQESHALSILSCFLRYNMSASACKDVLKTMKNLFPGSEADHVLDYARIWNTMAECALQLKGSHYCLMCCEVYPDNEDVFNCETYTPVTRHSVNAVMPP